MRFHPADQTEAQFRALQDAATREREEDAEAFKSGFSDAQAGLGMKGGGLSRRANTAYQSGYSRGLKGIKVKL